MKAFLQKHRRKIKWILLCVLASFLVLAWLACNTYPDAFADYPLGDTIKEYYKTWYGYDVTDDELEEMRLY